jgi:hypothetical protein
MRFLSKRNWNDLVKSFDVSSKKGKVLLEAGVL